MCTVECPFFCFAVRWKSPFLLHFHGFLAPTATLKSISGVLFEIQRAHTILILFMYEVTRSPWSASWCKSRCTFWSRYRRSQITQPAGASEYILGRLPTKNTTENPNMTSDQHENDLMEIVFSVKCFLLQISAEILVVCPKKNSDIDREKKAD